MTSWERDTVDITGEDTPPLRVERLARPAGVAPLLWTAHGFDHRPRMTRRSDKTD